MQLQPDIDSQRFLDVQFPKNARGPTQAESDGVLGNSMEPLGAQHHPFVEGVPGGTIRSKKT